MNKKDRDAVMNQIGRELYGNLWVCDELTTSEWTDCSGEIIARRSSAASPTRF